MKPVGKYIVIKTIEEEIKTSSGLLLSATDVDVSVVKPEDIIYYDKNSGFTMLIDEEPYTIIQERDVVIVL